MCAISVGFERCGMVKQVFVILPHVPRLSLEWVVNDPPPCILCHVGTVNFSLDIALTTRINTQMHCIFTEEQRDSLTRTLSSAFGIWNLEGEKTTDATSLACIRKLRKD